jgi:hypothetical protein
LLFLFLKGMTGALAPFSYLVKKNFTVFFSFEIPSVAVPSTLSLNILFCMPKASLAEDSNHNIVPVIFYECSA